MGGVASVQDGKGALFLVLRYYFYSQALDCLRRQIHVLLQNLIHFDDTRKDNCPPGQEHISLFAK